MPIIPDKHFTASRKKCRAGSAAVEQVLNSPAMRISRQTNQLILNQTTKVAMTVAKRNPSDQADRMEDDKNAWMHADISDV